MYPEVVLEYIHLPDYGTHLVFYRPALLNGRHVVDVLRAVCGPAYVSEAELDRVRREATDDATECVDWEGIWLTSWKNTVITTKN